MTAKRNIITFFIIGIAGTLSHFVYEWSGKIYSVGLFFPVNESTWEHLKLLFFPALIFMLAEYFTLEGRPANFIPAWTVGIFSGMLAIIVFFYTYKGVVGKNIDFLNIAIYFLGVAVMLFVKNKIINSDALKGGFSEKISVFILIIMSLLFAGLSFNPPPIGLFKDPTLTP